MTRALSQVVLTAGAVVVVLGGRAVAQDRFQTGPVAWTPVLTLREAGIDTNVFDEAANPRQDMTAVLSPQVTATLGLASMRVSTGAALDFVYFETYTSERGVNGRGTARLEAPLSRFRPFGQVGYLNSRERQSPEIDTRARRAQRELGGGLGIEVGGRAVVELSAQWSDLRYDQGQEFRDVDLGESLNRESRGVTGAVRYALSPLTQFVIDTGYSEDRFVSRPEQNTENLRASAGFEFAPDAIIRGRAVVGFRRIIAVDPAAGLSAEGVTTAVDLTYVLLGRTRFGGRIGRDRNYSIEAPHYLQTTYAFDVLHELFGPFDLTGVAARDRLEYPAQLDLGLTPHVDFVNRYGGGLGIRGGDRLRIGFNFELTERDSAVSADRNFDRRRLFTTVTYGF
jgi:hypothetical protein